MWSSPPASAPATPPPATSCEPSSAATALPVLVGSGATAANVGGILALADGVIVASSLKARRGLVERGRARGRRGFMDGGGAEPVRLLVLGNAAIDLSYPVSSLPIPGETLLAGAKQVEIGGKGLNQAVVAARAGAATRLVAAVGDDWAGAMIRDRLAAEKLDPVDLHIADAPTDESIIMVTPDGENAIVSTAAAAARLPLTRVAPRSTRWPPEIFCCCRAT